jgi:flagellar motor switch protein FliN/FliY
MPAITPGTPQHFLVDVLRKAVADVLSRTLGSPWSAEISPDQTIPSSEATTSFGLAPSGSVNGNAALQLRNSDVLLLAQRLLKATPDPAAELTPAHKQAVEELLRQVAGLVATGLQPQFGEVSLQLSSVDAPTWPGETFGLMASEASAAKLLFQLRLGTELLAGLPASPGTMTSAAAPPQTTAEDSPTAGNNMDLLLGVDLNLTLRFGQRTMTLREILDLSSGSVIELDRRVQEPADLLLGDKLVARGEVVIVDGNYGLRITEVCDPQHNAARGVLASA